MHAPLTIDVYSDTVCPWCYLGKRRLDAALQARPALAVEVRWRPFELNPDMPAGGAERGEYLRRKFGDGARLREIQERLTMLGAAAGIDYRFDRISRMPNTRAAHALAALAGERQGAVVEGLFRAYFEQGRDVGDLAVLAAVASDAGLDGAALRPRLAAAEAYASVAAEEREAQRLGITGVPFFVFAGRWAVSGAQESGALGAAIDQVVAELAREQLAPAAGPS